MKRINRNKMRNFSDTSSLRVCVTFLQSVLNWSTESDNYLVHESNIKLRTFFNYIRYTLGSALSEWWMRECIEINELLKPLRESIKSVKYKHIQQKFADVFNARLFVFNWSSWCKNIPKLGDFKEIDPSDQTHIGMERTDSIDI